MKRLLIFLVVFWILFPMAALSEQDENILPNNGFETLNDDGRPMNWYVNAYRETTGISRIGVTDTIAHTGRYSAMVENVSLNDARLICDVQVDPNSYYRLSGYIYVESMRPDGNGANFALENISAYSACLYADNAGEWKYVEFFGRTGDNQRAVSLGVRVGGYSAESIGIAYFDDLSLVKLEKLPKGVTATSWYPVPQAVSDSSEVKADGKSTVLFLSLAIAFVLFVWILAQSLRKRTVPLATLWFCVLAGLALAARLILAWNVAGYSVDIGCFTAWSTRIARIGPADFYAEDYFCDYPPGYILLLWPCGALLNVLDGYISNGALLLIVKSLPILCDIVGAGVLYHFAVKRVKHASALIVASVYLFNPASIVNSSAWGQADSVLALLLLICVLSAIKKNWRTALPVYTAAVLCKPQALLCAPIAGVWLLCCLLGKCEDRKQQLRSLLIGFLLSLMLTLAVVLPFSPRMPFGWLTSLYAKTLSSYPYVTLNTANFYYILGANWVKLDVVISRLLIILTMILSFTLGVCLTLRPREHTLVFNIHTKKTQIALLCFAFAAYQMVLLFTGADYRLYGYGMMAFIYVCAALFMLDCLNANHLPFILALALIGVYVLGLKAHERYLYPALLLLLAAYTTTRDKRVLGIAVGFSATTFVNTAIVLDNSILFGAQMGHLNLDTLPLNDALAVINLLLCGYAFYIGFTGLRESAEAISEGKARTVSPSYRAMLLHPPEARMCLGVRDFLVMGITAVLYAALTFTNLGATYAPQSCWVSSSSDEQIVFDLGQRQNFSLLYYGGVNYSDFSIAISEDGENWSESIPCQMSQAQCFQWLYVRTYTVRDGVVSYDNGAAGTMQLTGQYLRLNAENAGLKLLELVAKDADGTIIPMTLYSHTGARTDILDEPKPPENLIDEQDTFVAEPGWYTSMYFDEIYHARSAYHNLHGESPYETTHPPLGKLMISIGITLFGMTPFGWRFMGALVGVLMLPALYLLTLQISKKRDIATVAMLAFTFDLMHFTQTRIATIDSFPVLFILLSYLCMVRYMQTDVFALTEGERPRAFSRAFWKSLIPLGLSGMFMGLGIASKWIGIYSAVGLAVLFFITLYRQFAAGLAAYSMKSDEPRKQLRLQNARTTTLKRILITCGFCLVFFILVPCLIYGLSYIPYLSPTGPVNIKRIIDAQLGMLSYHSTPGLGMDHPFQSPWWQWPLILKPIWFAQDKYEPAGYASTIMCMGNPWVFYLGAVCMLAALVAFVCKYVKIKDARISLRSGNGDMTLPCVVIGFLAQYLPWVLVPRSMYIYHYFASVPFVILATVWVLNFLPESKPKLRHGLMLSYVLLAALFFAAFYPYASGLLTDIRWLDAMKWFSKLYY